MGENSPLFISIKQKINTMKVIFNFKKSTCRLNWVKILKVVFGFNLKEAKAIVDSGSYAYIVDGLSNPIDMQQYFVDLLIRIDAVFISIILLTLQQRSIIILKIRSFLRKKRAAALSNHRSIVLPLIQRNHPPGS